MIYLLCFGLSLMLGLIAYALAIPYLNKRNIKQAISEYAIKEYKDRPPVPLFGGVIFLTLTLVVGLVSAFMVKDLTLKVWWLVLALVLFGLIGLVDDVLIIRQGKNDGLKEKEKFLLQLIAGAVLMVFFYRGQSFVTLHGIFWPWQWQVPFILYLFFGIIYFAGFSNAVNITDGMDGLSSGVSLIGLASFAYLSYKANEMGILMLVLALMGALLAYWFYNKKPAKIYMGDCGSLAIGAFFAGLSILLSKEVHLLLIGGIFVLETASVILQVFSIKVFKKKIIPYSPIHYSFVLWGFKDPTIIGLFYGLALVLNLLVVVFQ